MAMTLQQIVDELNARHLTGDAARLLAYGQEQQIALEAMAKESWDAKVEAGRATEALANAEEEVTLVRGKLNDAEKLFDAAQARLGDKALGQAEVMAILGVTPAPETKPSILEQREVAVAEQVAKNDAKIAELDAQSVAAPDVHPFVAQITAAQQAAKAEEKPVTASDALEAAAQGPAVAQVVADLADRIAAQQQANAASDLPTAPPSTPVGGPVVTVVDLFDPTKEQK